MLTCHILGRSQHAYSTPINLHGQTTKRINETKAWHTSSSSSSFVPPLWKQPEKSHGQTQNKSQTLLPCLCTFRSSQQACQVPPPLPKRKRWVKRTGFCRVLLLVAIFGPQNSNSPRTCRKRDYQANMNLISSSMSSWTSKQGHRDRSGALRCRIEICGGKVGAAVFRIRPCLSLEAVAPRLRAVALPNPSFWGSRRRSQAPYLERVVVRDPRDVEIVEIRQQAAETWEQQQKVLKYGG